MTLQLCLRAKVLLLHALSYDFYDKTSPTEKQRRHMIKVNVNSVCLLVLEEVQNFGISTALGSRL